MTKEIHYQAVESSKLLRLSSVSCDIFVKLSDQKTVKIINANDFYDDDFILKHISRGIKFFYVRECDYLRFEDDYSDYLKLELSKKSPDLADSHEILKEAFKFVREFSRKIELAPKVAEIAEGIQRTSIESLRKNKKSFNLLCKKISYKDYLSEHSLMVSTVACSVGIHMSWSSEATLRKFVLASLFHDIALEDEKLAKIRTTGELDYGSFSEEERELVLQHTTRGYDAFAALDITCPNVDKIIMHHHELPDGSGFPSKLDAFNTPPYICLFNLAEEFVSTLHEQDFSDEAWLTLKNRFSGFYNKGNYRRPLKGFKMAFSKLSDI